MKADRDAISDFDFLRRTDDAAIRRLNDRVAAFQHSERTERVQRMRYSYECLVPILQGLVDRVGQPLPGQFNRMRATARQGAGLSDLFEPESEIVDLLREPADEIGRASCRE